MNSSYKKDDIRQRIIGLGEQSIRKNYYPQLQQKIDELIEQKVILENTNAELNNTLEALKETQTSLSKNEYKYRTLFENANDAIFIINSKGLNFIDCNSKALDLLNYDDKKEFIKRKVTDFFPDYQSNGRESIEFAREIIQKANQGHSQLLDWILLTKNANEIICVVSVNSINILGEDLVQIIIRDVTKVRKLEGSLAMATIRTIENERLRFAKELHDGIGPILSTIKLYIEWLTEDNSIDKRDIILSKANESIVEATNAIKEIAYNLSPHVLENYGFVSAIQQFIENIELAHSIKIKLSSNLKNRLESDYEILLYRVVTELINNTIKYANATTVKISITKIQNTLSFHYSDNGVGFELKSLDDENQGMGIFNIKNRVERVGGHVNIKSDKGLGVNFEFFIYDLEYLNENRRS